MNYCCSNMKVYIEDEKCILYSEVFDEYSIPCPSDNTQSYVLNYCPLCGKKLPNSKREAWFDKLETLGFDEPLFDGRIPEEFKSAKWRML